MTTIAPVASDPTRTFRALSLDEVRRLAPSVFAENARPGVSSRYTFVSTAHVIDLLRGEGWEPVLARQQRVRLPERQGFQMHELRFTPRGYLNRDRFEVGDVRPELVLQNAHDGTRAYRIDAGLYRLVCRNGLVVADAQFAHVAIRHFDVSAEKFAAAAQSVAESTPLVLETVARWQAVSLTPAARLDFAARALALRWDADQPVTRLLNPSQLLEPVRYGDHATDLWTVFNVLQERITGGGTRYSGHIPAAPGAAFPTRRLANTTRPVTGLKHAQRINKSLWQLASEFANN